MRPALSAAAILIATAAHAAPFSAAPVNDGPANAPWQTPAFPGQTRAEQLFSGVSYQVEQVAGGLQFPWGIDFLSDGRAVVTEKPGNLRVIQPDGSLSAPVSGVPAVRYGGQGGLLDVHVLRGTPDRLCLTYAGPRPGNLSSTAVTCATVLPDGNSIKLRSARLIWRQAPLYGGQGHYGSRVNLAPDGTLYITTGDRQDGGIRVEAQNPKTGIGKVVRLTQSGAVPADSPTYGTGPRSAFWSIGHRNVQGAAIHPVTGRLWTIEHGPRGGDELNVPVAGGNHGWPVVTYGIEYNGQPVGQGITQAPGIVQPVYYWDPVIAPGGMSFYSGAMFPAWRDSLFIASLGRGVLVRLTLGTDPATGADRVTGEERISVSGERLRDVAQAPDGSIWVITDSANGRVLRLRRP